MTVAIRAYARFAAASSDLSRYRASVRCCVVMESMLPSTYTWLLHPLPAGPGDPPRREAISDEAHHSTVLSGRPSQSPRLLLDRFTLPSSKGRPSAARYINVGVLAHEHSEIASSGRRR